jgi:hypothetical protein
MPKRATLQEVPHSIGPLVKGDLVVRCQQILGELPCGLRCGGDGECIYCHAQNNQPIDCFHCFVLPLLGVRSCEMGQLASGEWKVASTTRKVESGLALSTNRCGPDCPLTNGGSQQLTRLSSAIQEFTQ